MLYFLLICFIFILAFSLFSIIRTIRNINKQIKQQRKIRVSLSNRDIEELAYAINQKDNLHKKLQVQIKQEEEQLKQSIRSPGCNSSKETVFPASSSPCASAAAVVAPP